MPPEQEAMKLMPESVSPEGLRARADMLRGRINDSDSTCRHLELAADEIERLRRPLAARGDATKPPEKRG